MNRANDALKRADGKALHPYVRQMNYTGKAIKSLKDRPLPTPAC